MRKMLFPLATLVLFCCFIFITNERTQAQLRDEEDAGPQIFRDTQSDGFLILRTAYIHCESYEDEGVHNKYCNMLRDSYDLKATFKAMRDEYHDETNAYLNKKISKISGTTFRCDAKRDNISFKNNIVAVYEERQEELWRYQSALTTLAYRARTETPFIDNPQTLKQAFNNVLFLEEEVLDEFDLAERSLRIAINTYGEMRLFYPLHAELQCVIVDLQQLRNSWEKFVRVLTRMPAKFLNASENCA